MIMSVPTGSAASSWTDERPETPVEQAASIRRPGSAYLQNLALRRQAAAIRQQTVYGLVMGWVLTVVAGFVFFCVPSRVDLLWAALIVVGLLHLAAAVVLPQALSWPERVWIAVARWQGWLVMTILLTFVYFALVWPTSYFSRRHRRGFVAWDDESAGSATRPVDGPVNGREGTVAKRWSAATAWEKIDLGETETALATGQRYRSLPLLLASVIAFFFRRGNYLLLSIVILLVVLGLALYFVQSSALAPFIYT